MTLMIFVQYTILTNSGESAASWRCKYMESSTVVGPRIFLGLDCVRWYIDNHKLIKE